METVEASPVVPLRKPLLSESFKQPLVLLGVSVLPQLILLLLNLRGFWLLSDECELWQRGMFYRIFAFELVMIIGAAALAFRLHLRGQLISWKLSSVLLIVPVIYLWMVVQQMGSGVIPDSVAAWILPPDQVLYYQFALMMPVIFYAIVRLSCMDIQISPYWEVVIVLTSILWAPCLYLLISTLHRIFGFDLDAGVIPVMIVFILAGVILIAGVTRACVSGYNAIRRRGARSLGGLTFLVGIIGPFAGLWLNSKIPFPADFQSWTVFAMALVNGLVLMLPRFEGPGLRRWTWFAQCAFFPFTLYFYVVFLPFLPLFLPAMLALGAGCLILTPTVLFFVHGQRILDGYREEIEATGGRWMPTLLAVLALMILPGITITQAIIDRVVLHRAMDYVFTPDYRQPDRFAGSRWAVQRSLERLRDFKAGAYLPFFSDFYNWAVFGNLVLPDDKMSEISRAFFGKELEPAKDNMPMVFSERRQRRWRTNRDETRRRQSQPIPSDITLTQLAAKSVPDGVCERTRFTLDLRNNALAQSEFVTTIRIPDGVFVSGFWLKIGKELVPGKLFEQKTALWVYEKIRDERSNRDPGILVYSAPNSMELRIFPFASMEERQVEIEFLYPANLDPTIAFGERQWRKEPVSKGMGLTLTAEGGSSLSLPPQTLPNLPRVSRVPYLHFIVDRSADSKLTDEELVQAIRKTAAQFEGAKECRLTLANYESVDLAKAPMPIDSIDAGMLKDRIPRRGGFLAGRAIKRVLLAYHDRISRAQAQAAELHTYPVVILVGDSHENLALGKDLGVFGAFAPDSERFYFTSKGETFQSFEFNGKADPGPIRKGRPVALLKVGETIAPCVLDASEPQMIAFETSKGERKLSVLDQGSFHPLEVATIIPPEAPYATGISALHRYLAWVTNPSLGNNGLAEVVALSRKTGILLAATSYIVVENSAQWKMLALKEKQKLANQVALEFEEVPEPASWVLLLAGALVLYRFQRGRKVGMAHKSGSALGRV